MLHFYHCTDGQDAVFDFTGRPDGDADERIGRALDIARDLMAQLPSYKGWRSWTVCIHDGDGHLVDLVPFPARPAPGPVARRTLELAS